MGAGTGWKPANAICVMARERVLDQSGFQRTVDYELWVDGVYFHDSNKSRYSVIHRAKIVQAARGGTIYKGRFK